MIRVIEWIILPVERNSYASGNVHSLVFKFYF